MRADQDSGKVLEAMIVGLDGAPDESLLNVFQGYGGSVRFSSGTHMARLCRITASCTEGERAAVKAWLRKAKEVRDANEKPAPLCIQDNA
ncbi:hypothetical protein FBT96_20085 [Rhodobacter capsulatus]|uniref:Uncharacterized protein n=1 Tax=Rhodobacter capsulatus TaxID=1061 RepID=A0A4U1JK54_RHOCA|nr:hypothetical protein [Rhodobacter capsulatus]TKD12924.1 hypothetical protein FBT96_20085 [Rhodobacter capsulatus]